jgi:hypothetical protein
MPKVKEWASSDVSVNDMSIVVPDIVIPVNAMSGRKVRWSRITRVTDDQIICAFDWFIVKYPYVARDKILCYDVVVNALIDVIIQINPLAADADRGDLKAQIMKVGKNGNLNLGKME